MFFVSKDNLSDLYYSYLAFVLSLSFPHLSFWCLGIAVFRDSDIFLVSSHIVGILSVMVCLLFFWVLLIGYSL